MGHWEKVWQGGGSRQLWATPDPAVVALAAEWKLDPTIRRVLDIGCGIGRHVHFLASQGFEVTGVDHSSTALESCGRWLESEGLRATLHCGEMDEMPFPAESFDAVVAFNSIYHGTGDQVRSIFGDVSRMLRPGGACFVTLPTRENRLYGRGEKIAPHTFRGTGMYQSILGNSGEAGAPHYFSSEEDVQAFFHDFKIRSQSREELQLASQRSDGSEPRLMRIRNTFFWRVTAQRLNHA